MLGDKSDSKLDNMFINRYLFSVAIFANIFLNVSSLDFKCVSASFGILDGEPVFDLVLQVSASSNEVNIPQVCHIVGVVAKVCSADDDHLEVVVTNADKVLVSSGNVDTIFLKLFCDKNLTTAQDQLKSNVTKGLDEDKLEEVKVLERAPAEVAKVLQEVAQIKEGANRAQGTVNRVKVGAAKAQLNAQKTQDGIDKAQKDLAKALIGGGEAQLRVKKAEHSLAKAQRRVNKAQNHIYGAQKRAKKAEHNVDKAKKRAAKAQQRVSKDLIKASHL